MVKRNLNFDKVSKSYLFVEIEERKAKFRKQYPDAKILSLGIGDTTEPIPMTVAEGFLKKVGQLTTYEGYTGYPKVGGTAALKQSIATQFCKDHVDADEVFISDGSRSDCGRLLYLFPSGTRIAVQDPIYPAYIDQIVIQGLAGDFDAEKKQYSNIIYMPCTPENRFFPDLKSALEADVIIFCSPNNPTGAGYDTEQLTQLVNFAREHKKLIFFDAAYQQFIDPEAHVPTTIYEIPGAREVVIETGSFSKPLGFTGVRLGWVVMPRDMRFEDGHSVQEDWRRISGTFFNGPSNLAEAGATAAFTPEGLRDMKRITDTYMHNARKILVVMKELGFSCYGGEHAPYVWVKVQKDSWAAWEELFHGTAVVTTPGLGFGPQGDSFLRFSGFARPSTVDEAMTRIREFYGSAKGSAADPPSGLQGS